MKLFFSLISSILIFLFTANGQSINMSNGTVTNPCSYTTFYDNNGTSNYNKNQNITTTFCAPSAQYIYFNFSQFALESKDTLKVYNGATSTAPLIGAFTGTISPGFVTSAPGGCLTFVFTSNANGQDIGWVSSITCSTLAPLSPTNDNPCNAIPLAVNSNCSFSSYSSVNATTTQGVSNPTCGSYAGGDVWFSIVVPASGSLIVDANFGTVTDGAMALYTGTCSSLTQVACDDDGSANGLMPLIQQSGLTPGTTVFIRFWTRGTNNNGTFSLCAQQGITCNASNTNGSCVTADPVCTGVSYDYCNSINIPSLGGGGIYGCLASSPNPSFYFINIAQSGPVNFQISQQTNTGVGIDVDYIIWGPFSSQANMCGNLLSTNIVSCSYSTAAIENASIPNAIAGQWYMVLITNFSNVSGVVNFTQTNTTTAGAGSTNCNVLTVNPSACTGGYYNISGNIVAPSASTLSGTTLTITNSCGGSTTINSPFTSPIPYSIPNICASTPSCTVSASFSGSGAPVILPATYTAPNCNTFTATAGPCDATTKTYILSGQIIVGCNLPTTGTLTISSSCGVPVVYTAPFSSTYNWSLPPKVGTRANCTITAVFSAAGAPIFTPIVIREPQCTNCTANAGTSSATVTNGTSTILPNGTRQIILCPNGSVKISEMATLTRSCTSAYRRA